MIKYKIERGGLGWEIFRMGLLLHTTETYAEALEEVRINKRMDSRQDYPARWEMENKWRDDFAPVSPLMNRDYPDEI